MKIINTVLVISLALITAALIYIIKAGVSIRTAPIIKPSPVGLNLENIPKGVFLRLFPDFQQAYYTIWGLPKGNPEPKKVLDTLKAFYEKDFKTKVHILESENITDNSSASAAETLKNCPQPCWIVQSEKNANELIQNSWIEKNIKVQGKEYFTLTWINFSRNPDVPDHCLKEKRLDLECLKVISIVEVQKNMRDPKERYFFVRKYMDRDYFLFVENPN
ncbi:MAG: hypothetical protein ACXVCP_00125 [Bdellovibrio sp.]